MFRPLLVLAVSLLLASVADAASSCRTDRLGNTICTGPEGSTRSGPFGLPADREPPAFIPSWRGDAFGTVRPQRPPVTGRNPFGKPPRPEKPVRCSTDSFGNVRC